MYDHMCFQSHVYVCVLLVFLVPLFSFHFLFPSHFCHGLIYFSFLSLVFISVWGQQNSLVARSMINFVDCVNRSDANLTLSEVL